MAGLQMLGRLGLRSTVKSTSQASQGPLGSSSATSFLREATLLSTRQPAARQLSRTARLSASSAGAQQDPVLYSNRNPASRPYARHRPSLPQPPSYKLPIAIVLVFSLVSWGAFTIHATNRERLSSSVLKNVVDRIKTSPAVEQTLGEDVTLRREMILAGDPYIRGSVNIMQGRVDMSFKVKGTKDSGTTYFSAIRREPGQPYETLRFLIVLDSTGETISLLDEE